MLDKSFSLHDISHDSPQLAEAEKEVLTSLDAQRRTRTGSWPPSPPSKLHRQTCSLHTACGMVLTFTGLDVLWLWRLGADGRSDT